MVDTHIKNLRKKLGIEFIQTVRGVVYAHCVWDGRAGVRPAPITAVFGNPVSAKELQVMVEEYGKFGITYDARDGQWYFNGEKVRYFRDILTSKW